MKEQFEKLLEIAEKLKHVWWNEDRNQYCDTGKHPSSNGAFLNGALYAYIEQQKKIDEVLNLVCKLQYSSGERIYSEVKELLK